MKKYVLSLLIGVCRFCYCMVDNPSAMQNSNENFDAPIVQTNNVDKSTKKNDGQREFASSVKTKCDEEGDGPSLLVHNDPRKYQPDHVEKVQTPVTDDAEKNLQERKHNSDVPSAKTNGTSVPPSQSTKIPHKENKPTPADDSKEGPKCSTNSANMVLLPVTTVPKETSTTQTHDLNNPSAKTNRTASSLLPSREIGHDSEDVVNSEDSKESVERENNKQQVTMNFVLFFLMLISLFGIGAFIWFFNKKGFGAELEAISRMENLLSEGIGKTNERVVELTKWSEGTKQDMLGQIVAITQIINQNAETSKMELGKLREILNSLLRLFPPHLPPQPSIPSQNNGQDRKYEDANATLNADLRREKEKTSKLERSLSEAEKKGWDLSQENKKIRLDIAKLEEQMKNIQGERSELECKYNQMQQRCRDLESVVAHKDSIYGLGDKPELNPYLEKLQVWNNSAPRDVAIIKSALVLGAMPIDKVDNDTFMGALKDISMSITSIMLGMRKSETEIRAELQGWASCLQRAFSSPNRQFSLVVPEVGGAVDVTCMRIHGNAANRVNGVRSWAVYGPFAVKYMAEIV